MGDLARSERVNLELTMIWRLLPKMEILYNLPALILILIAYFSFRISGMIVTRAT